MRYVNCLVSFLCLVLTSPFVAGQQSQQPGLAQLSFTSYDVQGAVVTAIEDINASGLMAGYYGFNTNGPATGFLLRNGALTTFTYSNSSTLGIGLNDAGVVAGYALVGNAFVAFTYDGTAFTTVGPPGKSESLAYGISNAGIVVGGAGDGLPNEAFENRAGRIRNITPPPGGFIESYGAGVNIGGEVIGFSIGPGTIGFDYKNGKYRNIVAPGSAGVTEALDINNNGVIVGWYESCALTCASHGFAMKGGKYLTVDYPGAKDSFALGINDAGQIVGGYDYGDNVEHGFYTTPLKLGSFEVPGVWKVDPNWKEN